MSGIGIKTGVVTSLDDAHAADLTVGANGQHQTNLARVAIGRHGFKNQGNRLAGQACPIECRDVAQAKFGCRG